jgi:hypothetical protein
VLRAALDGVALGRRTADRAPLEPLSPALPFTRRDGESPYHEMRVERHGSFWRASFDGEPVGSLPAPEQREATEFRLVTEGGPAFFDALEVAELVSPER